MNVTDLPLDRIRMMGLSRRRKPTLGVLSLAVSMLFLVGQQTSYAAIVFWDPVDMETTILSQIRVDTGTVGNNNGMNPGSETDFTILPNLSLVGGQAQLTGIVLRREQSPLGSPLFFGTGIASDGDTLGSSFGRLLRLPAGSVIGPNTPFTNFAFAYNLAIPGPYKWSPGDDGFVGLELSVNGQTHYGWAGLNLGSSIGSYTLTSFAYETNPNTPIMAGAGATTAVPEPSTLGLAGAVVGLIALRRARRPRVVSVTNFKEKAS
ncbi:MAG: PEP-CTERM sorting domain-containing protein [Planctomycetota bacterium]